MWIFAARRKWCAMPAQAERSMAIAVRIARAHTQGEIKLLCGYHECWHDWYLAANLGQEMFLMVIYFPASPRDCTTWARWCNTTFFATTILRICGQSLLQIEMSLQLLLWAVRDSDRSPGFLERIRELA